MFASPNNSSKRPRSEYLWTFADKVALLRFLKSRSPSEFKFQPTIPSKHFKALEKKLSRKGPAINAYWIKIVSRFREIKLNSKTGIFENSAGAIVNFPDSRTEPQQSQELYELMKELSSHAVTLSSESSSSSECDGEGEGEGEGEADVLPSSRPSRRKTLGTAHSVDSSILQRIKKLEANIEPQQQVNERLDNLESETRNFSSWGCSVISVVNDLDAKVTSTRRKVDKIEPRLRSALQKLDTLEYFLSNYSSLQLPSAPRRRRLEYFPQEDPYFDPYPSPGSSQSTVPNETPSRTPLGQRRPNGSSASTTPSLSKQHELGGDVNTLYLTLQRIREEISRNRATPSSSSYLAAKKHERLLEEAIEHMNASLKQVGQTIEEGALEPVQNLGVRNPHFDSNPSSQMATPVGHGPYQQMQATSVEGGRPSDQYLPAFQGQPTLYNLDHQSSILLQSTRASHLSPQVSPHNASPETYQPVIEPRQELSLKRPRAELEHDARESRKRSVRHDRERKRESRHQTETLQAQQKGPGLFSSVASFFGLQ